MKRVRLFFIFFVMGLFLPKMTRAAALAIQEATFAKKSQEIVVNVHRYGVGVAVINPTQTPGLSREIQIRDLGPDVKDLVEDRQPTTAWAWVNNQPPVAFQPAGRDTLRLVIPKHWLRLFGRNEVHVSAWDNQGIALVQTSLDGTFF
ncbi:MAG TPA: hypothetical protein QGG59_01260 [Planctomycetota bacterium]|jgi:hypothetical protein|nr:hypothetical protein [Planctomycetota bacterium]MDP6128331.1 hypothetical protein [Planctomycetota bacterium]MDP7245119.1 hypothetical protein [Planctomycetota bacterium]MDP7560090.1 hypothetical protein [Planctomycetota bacterium]HJM38720.1 hypothetical protein [Planctomycetota bacterium]